MPGFIDNQLQDVAKYRRKFIRAWADGGSAIDANITFRNTKDMIAYVPRALQIAFLSPFPTTWFSEGRKEAGNAMRFVSSFEMLFSYLCLLGLPVFVFNKRKDPSLWMLLAGNVAMLTIYAMTIPNIGALYRFRYPYFMPLVCLGLAGWVLSVYNKTFFWSEEKSEDHY